MRVRPGSALAVHSEFASSSVLACQRRRTFADSPATQVPGSFGNSSRTAAWRSKGREHVKVNREYAEAFAKALMGLVGSRLLGINAVAGTDRLELVFETETGNLLTISAKTAYVGYVADAEDYLAGSEFMARGSS